MPAAPRRLLFGTAGVPHSASDDSTLAALDRLHALGLDGLEPTRQLDLDKCETVNDVVTGMAKTSFGAGTASNIRFTQPSSSMPSEYTAPSPSRLATARDPTGSPARMWCRTVSASTARSRSVSGV